MYPCSILTEYPTPLYECPTPILHSKSQIDWNSSVSETSISLQNRYSCMYLMEIIFNNFMTQMLSETNNPSKVIWNKAPKDSHVDKNCKDMPKIWQRYAKYSPKICQIYAKYMQNICQRYQKYTPNICQRYPKDIPNICQIYAKDTQNIPQRYAKDTPKTYQIYAKYIPNICQRYPKYMPKIPQYGEYYIFWFLTILTTVLTIHSSHKPCSSPISLQYLTWWIVLALFRTLSLSIILPLSPKTW